MTETLKSNNLTAGTNMPNRKHLPVELTKKSRSALSAFKDDLTMCLCILKKNKLVLLLSTAHQSESGKPEIVKLYNETKAGVDALDQNVQHPMAVFYNFLDIPAYNAYVLFKLQPPSTGFNLNPQSTLQIPNYAWGNDDQNQYGNTISTCHCWS